MPFGRSEKSTSLLDKLRKAKQSVANSLHEHPTLSDSISSTSSSHPPRDSHVAQNLSVTSVADHPQPDLPHQLPPPDSPTQALRAIEPQVVARPFVKIKVITWNMAESLPTGDLTELLGSVPSPEACNNLPRSPVHPDLPELPLNEDHLYHIIVVGAQESPWLPSTIHDIRAGGKRNKQPHSKTTWTDVLTDWFCRGAGHKYHEQCPTSPRVDDTPMTPSAPNLKRAPTTQTPEDALAQKGEHPVQRLDVQAPLEQALLDERKNPLGDLPDSPVKSKEKPPRRPAPESAPSVRSISSSSSSSLHASQMASSSQQGQRQDSADAPPSDTSSVTGESAETSTLEQGEVGPYVFVAKERMLGIYVSVFVLKSAHHLLQGVAKGKVTAGLLGGRMGNKGAAAISLNFAGLRFLFLSAHLAAHQNNLSARRQNIDKIKSELDIDCFQDSVQDEALKEQLDELDDITDRFDSCFWFGDLNFRLTISRLHADFLLKSKNYEHMLAFDQLNAMMKERNHSLKGFKEGAIHFAPTYKYDMISRKKLHRRSTQSASDRASFKNRPQSISSLNATSMSAVSEASPSAHSEAADNSDAASMISTTTAGFDSAGETRPDTPSAFSSPAELDENALIPAAVQKARMKIMGIMRSKSTMANLSVAQIMASDDGASDSDQQKPPKSPRPELLRSTQSEHPTHGVLSDEDEHNESLDQVAVFDSSRKQRVQSYTDRILYKSSATRVKDMDRSIARKLGAGIVDGLRTATRTFYPTTGSGPPSISSGRGAGPSSPHGSRQVSFDVNDSPSHSTRLLSTVSSGSALPSLTRNTSTRSQASSHHSTGSRGPLKKILAHRRHARQGSSRRHSFSLPGPNKSDGDLLSAGSPQPRSANTPYTNNMTESPVISNVDLTPVASPSSPSSPTSPASDFDTPRAISSGQVHFPGKERREHSKGLSLSKTMTDVSVNDSPSRARSYRPTNMSFSLRHWLNNHLPVWSPFGNSTDSLGMSQLSDSPLETPDPETQILLVGPKPGQIQCLAYDTANDLRKMEAYSDHRPLFGVYAVGLKPVT